MGWRRGSPEPGAFSRAQIARRVRVVTGSLALVAALGTTAVGVAVAAEIPGTTRSVATASATTPKGGTISTPASTTTSVVVKSASKRTASTTTSTTTTTVAPRSTTSVASTTSGAS